MRIPPRIVVALVALAVAIVPAAALAHGKSQMAPGHSKSTSTTTTSPRSQAEKQCRKERTADGTSAFEKTFGTNGNGRNAFGKCVAHRTQQNQAAHNQHTESAEVKAEENAARQCRSEQQSDPAAFKDKYGTNHNKANAFGKCASQRAHQQEQQSGSGSGGGSGSNG